MYIDGKYVNVIINRKKIKNTYYRIDDEGNIVVNCPKYVLNLEIQISLNKNIKSITRMYNNYLKKKDKKDEVLYLGNKLNYIYDEKVKIDGNNAYGPSIESINNYLESNSIKLFEKRLDYYLPYYDNIPYFKLKTRKMKTRWGVNNRSSKTITLNTLLIHYKISDIDYVIVHELSHFKHMDHSKLFWNEVERVYPDYKIARKDLRY